jgi:hypothetical protein
VITCALVVVDLGSGLAGVGAQDPTCVLHQTSFERDRRGQEERVQSGTVEALADVRAGGHGKQRWTRRNGDQPGQGLPAGRDSQSSGQDGRVVTPVVS